MPTRQIPKVNPGWDFVVKNSESRSVVHGGDEVSCRSLAERFNEDYQTGKYRVERFDFDEWDGWVF